MSKTTARKSTSRNTAKADAATAAAALVVARVLEGNAAEILVKLQQAIDLLPEAHPLVKALTAARVRVEREVGKVEREAKAAEAKAAREAKAAERNKVKEAKKAEKAKKLAERIAALQAQLDKVNA